MSLRRLPVYILADVSGSMRGTPVESVKAGIRQLHRDLLTDPQAVESAYLSVITFADVAIQVVPLTEVSSFIPPEMDANGQTNYLTRTVTVRADLPLLQAVKTVAHELGHVFLHADAGRKFLDRSRIEVEAESVAYLICHGLGINSDGYSFPYLARWCRGDVDLIRATAGRAISCARSILTDLGMASNARQAA